MGGGMMGGGKGSTGGMMRGMATHDEGNGGGQGRGAAWSINGMSMTGDGQADMPPLLTLERGRSVMLALRNETAWLHPMHLHGHSFRVLKRNGSPVPYRQWADTVLVSPQEMSWKSPSSPTIPATGCCIATSWTIRPRV